MAWRRKGDKLIPEPTMTYYTDAVCMYVCMYISKGLGELKSPDFIL